MCFWDVFFGGVFFNVQVVCVLSTVETENAYTHSRLEGLYKFSVVLIISHLVFFHSYHLYHSYLQDSLHIFRGSWVLISIRHLVEDLIKIFLLVV